MDTSSQAAHAENGSHSAHILPLKLYLFIGGGLLVLTVITVLASQVNFGSSAINLVIAMTIATIKAILVVLFFMHLKYDNRLYAIIFSIALIALTVFIVLTMFDTLNRAVVNEESGKPIHEKARIYQEKERLKHP